MAGRWDVARRHWGGGLVLTCAGWLVLGGCVGAHEGRLAGVHERAAGPWRNDPGKLSGGAARVEVAGWWRGLGDPVLAELAGEALQANLDLQVARERIVEARARRGVVDADRLPRVDAEAAYTRAGLGDDALAFAAPRPGVETNLFAAGVVAGWEVDLWGRVKRLVEAADADAAAAVEDYRDAAVSVVAEVALAYIDVRTLQQRLELLDESVALQQRSLELAQTRFDAGTGNEFDVSRAKRLLKRTMARKPELRRGIAVAENRLAVLLGKRPADDLVPAGALPAAGLPGDAGLPAELITRRPDVRRAAAQYRAALARTKAADLAHLPKLSLSGSFQLSAADLGKFTESAWVYSFGPSISFPLFDAGRIDANVRVRNAQAEQARLGLEKALLSAVAEVENAAVGYSKRREQVAQLESAVRAAQRSAEMAEDLYEAGLRGMTEVLEAQRSLVDVQDELAVSRQQVLAELVQLYRALGGGWEVVGLDGQVAAALAEGQS